MNRLKPVAQEILDVKKEMLNNNHSFVVKKALEVAIDRMLVEGYIDLDIQLYLKDNKYPLDELRKVIESSDKYIKTEEELLIEYETLTEKLNVLLEGFGLNEDDYYLNVDLQSDRINICKVFSLEEKFLKRYFYIQGDADEYFEKLMKKKGFIQQSAVLRLPRILANFIDMYPPSSEYKLIKSHAYFQADKRRYSIDLVFSIDTTDVEKMDLNSPVLEEISNIINEANKYFEDKLSI